MSKIDPSSVDPIAVFGTPERVRDSTELTTDEKIEVLKRWAYDDSEMAVAVEEGMPEGTQVSLQRRILLALQALGWEADAAHAGPTKQHGLSRPVRKDP